MKLSETPKNFVKCGLCGWGFECIWTGLHSVLKKGEKNMSVPDFPLDVSYLRHGLSHPAYASDPQKEKYTGTWNHVYILYLLCRIWHRKMVKKEPLLPLGLQ